MHDKSSRRIQKQMPHHNSSPHDHQMRHSLPRKLVMRCRGPRTDDAGTTERKPEREDLMYQGNVHVLLLRKVYKPPNHQPLKSLCISKDTKRSTQHIKAPTPQHQNAHPHSKPPAYYRQSNCKPQPLQHHPSHPPCHHSPPKSQSAK